MGTGPQSLSPSSRSARSADQARGPLRVLVCDDHEVYRLGLRAVLSDVSDMVVVGEAADARHALMIAFDTSPDVVLVGQGFDDGASALIRRLDPERTGVVVLAESEDEEGLVQALRAGARGYMTRRVPPSRLLDGIRAVARRETAVDSCVAGHLVRYLEEDQPAHRAPQGPAAPTGSLRGQLTERQLVVAGLVAEGLSNAEIAARLYLSPATIKSHLTIILRRLNLRDRTQLAILVSRDHLVAAGEGR